MSAATPEQVDVVTALTQVQKLIGETCVQLVTGQGVSIEEWIALGDFLRSGAKLCQAQVVLEADDSGTVAPPHDVNWSPT